LLQVSINFEAFNRKMGILGQAGFFQEPGILVAFTEFVEWFKPEKQHFLSAVDMPKAIDEMAFCNSL